MTEERCPYCNGTGNLPAATVERFERRRDEYAVRLQTINNLMAALYRLKSTAYPSTPRKEAALTVEGLRLAIRAEHARFRYLPHEYGLT